MKDKETSGSLVFHFFGQIYCYPEILMIYLKFPRTMKICAGLTTRLKEVRP